MFLSEYVANICFFKKSRRVTRSWNFKALRLPFLFSLRDTREKAQIVSQPYFLHPLAVLINVLSLGNWVHHSSSGHTKNCLP